MCSLYVATSLRVSPSGCHNRTTAPAKGHLQYLPGLTSHRRAFLRKSQLTMSTLASIQRHMRRPV
ncbi:hypothetical protein MA16_Dca009522 [Dendrobium catenatum]|uniref:Uncharacterized protein n=1 Tax=Dendrobium catenatum TaxID=906689 RepID=A0A2I0VRW2_9ASPA|nr:hypothetical protein MA16_Dca009522 [Dendrobium catenatum]